MTPITAAYRDRPMSAEQAVSLIPDAARIGMAPGGAQSPALPHALAARAEALIAIAHPRFGDEPIAQWHVRRSAS